jgi:formamidopyrimidine-DNA glycosylase
MPEEQYKPGDKVPRSGIYRVIHDSNHHEEHEVTCVYGKAFPPCNHCGRHVRFELFRAAVHIATHKEFKR